MGGTQGPRCSACRAPTHLRTIIPNDIGGTGHAIYECSTCRNIEARRLGAAVDDWQPPAGPAAAGDRHPSGKPG